MFMKVEVSVPQLYPTLCDSMDYSLCPWGSPGKTTGVGGHSLLQGIVLTQGSNLGLLHHRQILYPPRTAGAQEAFVDWMDDLWPSRLPEWLLWGTWSCVSRCLGRSQVTSPEGLRLQPPGPAVAQPG